MLCLCVNLGTFSFIIYFCNVRAIRYKRILFFCMDCRDAYRFVRCGFVYVIVCYCAAFMYAAALLCGRAYVMPRTLILPRSIVPRTCMLPRPMVPRVRPNDLSSLCCRVPWCRAGGQMVCSLCCRVPWCRALSYCRAP